VTGLRFVDDHAAEFPIERMCHLLDIPRSSFYAWRTHTPSARDRADAELLAVIVDPRGITGHLRGPAGAGPAPAPEHPGGSLNGWRGS